MTAENRQYYHDPRSESNAEGLLVRLQQKIKIVPSKSHFAIHPYITGNQVIPTEILPAELALVASTEFTVHDQPIFHYDSKGNRTSDTGYRINNHITSDGKHKIFVGELVAGSKTSRHSHPTHPPVIEHYFLLYGKAFINGEPMQERHIVHPGNEHQITTAGDPALLLIFMENGGLVPEDMLHIPSLLGRG